MKKNKKKNNNKKLIVIVITILAFISIGTISGVIFYQINKNNKCDIGYSYKNKRCEKEIYEEPTIVYSCEEGYEKKNNNVCVKNEKVEATKKYSCKAMNNTKNYNVSDPVLEGSECKYTYSYEAQSTTTCQKDCFLESDGRCKCTKMTSATEVGTGFSRTYKCESGELFGNKCVITTYQNATTKNYCMTGYKLSGKTCSKVQTISASYEYVCEEGFTKKGSSCERTLENDAKAEKTCTNGYELLNDKCIKTEIKESKK